MKSLVWTGPRAFRLEEREIPEPAPGELLLRVEMAGICGSDLSGYLGENSLRKPPLVMGHEMSATVAAAAPGVRGFTPGQRVTVNPLVSCGTCRACRRGMRQLCRGRSIVGIHRPGAFAEYLTAPAGACFPVGQPLAAALAEPLACSVRAAGQAGVRLGDDVLVVGAGIIGLMAAKVAELMGAARRIMVDTNDARLAHAASWGATHTVNPRQEGLPEALARIAPEGVDRAIDAVGLPQTRRDCIGAVRPGGSVSFVGLHDDETAVPGNTIVRQEIEIRGSFSYSDDDFHTSLQLLEDGAVAPAGAWLDIRPLEDGPAAFEEQIFGPAAYSKIVLAIG